MASKQQVATAPKPEAEPEAKPGASGRQAPLLKSTALTWNSDGFVWREALVRLPAEAILQDLNDPGIWRSIQSTPQKALRPLDKLMIVAFDQSWLVKDAIVVEADHSRAVLVIRPGDVVRMPGKTSEWQDADYLVRWAGSGFHVVRKRDGAEVLPPHFNTLEAANRPSSRPSTPPSAWPDAKNRARPA